jgi:hypothetical protein
MRNLLKWLFTKQQGDEDPIVLVDGDHPLTEVEIKELDNNQAAQDILKNISVTPKVEKPEVVVKAEVTIAVVKPVDEIKVEVVIPEPPKPPEVKPLPPPQHYDDGFTSTGSVYGKKRSR